MSGLSEILSTFRPISLREMDEVALTNRIDTKFVFHRSLLPDLLMELQRDYAVLEIGPARVHRYDTIYFDKEDYRLYLDHHNGRGNRYKLRLRQYGSSLVAYVEMKRKTNKGAHREDSKKNNFFFDSTGRTTACVFTRGHRRKKCRMAVFNTRVL